MVSTLLVRFARDESGRGLAEMVLVAGTALLIIPTVNEIGTRLAAVFEKLARALH